jgi:PAS domain S-box-containing protein
MSEPLGDQNRNPQARADATELLIEAGAVLATSLDLATTMTQVASLTVPRLADLCVIDLVADDGSISDVAVVAAEPSIAHELEQLRERYPLNPAGRHPVAHVIRSGEPQLLPEMTTFLLRSFAEGSEHARFMIDHDYRSAVVAPLTARARTLGALSVLRLGEHLPFSEEEAALVHELALRAALAIDNARLFGELRALERRQDAILANLAEAITVEDRSGQTVFANQAAADLLLAATPAELMSSTLEQVAERFQMLDEQERELDVARMPRTRVFAGERPEPLLVRNIVRATGEERWLIVRSSPIIDPATGVVEFAVNVYEDITEVKRAQLAESFMAQASRVLSSSMDYAETLKRVARLAVPALADWCSIDVLDEQGAIEQVAVHHAVPAKVALAERIYRLHRPEPDQPTGVPAVIRSSEPVLFTDISPQVLAGYAANSEHLELLSAVGAHSLIIVPLTSAVRTIGAITLVSSESGRRLSARDVALAERLGRRAGTAVENARLYTERARIAHVLQEALLPESLPQVPGLEIEARYRAAGEYNEVGGDFYDAFAHGDDELMLVIGDVVGKGPRAAGVTALARHTLRAASMSGRSPTGMLEMLHAALSAQPPGADLCTVCLVRIAPNGGTLRLTVVLAGHPPPLLISADGRARQAGAPGTLLGVLDPVRFNATDVELAPEETLLLYTDGVPDAGHPGDALGEDGLIELCRSNADLALPDLLERIEQVAVQRAQGALRDDVALLGLRLAQVAPATLISPDERR